jgi:RNA recognition motif-containing protein
MKIFVGNISEEFTEEDLKNLFFEFGEIEEVQIIHDKYTKESRNFGYIKMPNKEEAWVAIASLNGKDVQGKKILVNQARKGIEGREEGNRRSGPPRFK